MGMGVGVNLFATALFGDDGTRSEAKEGGGGGGDGGGGGRANGGGLDLGQGSGEGVVDCGQDLVVVERVRNYCQVLAEDLSSLKRSAGKAQTKSQSQIMRLVEYVGKLESQNKHLALGRSQATRLGEELRLQKKLLVKEIKRLRDDVEHLERQLQHGERAGGGAILRTRSHSADDLLGGGVGEGGGAERRRSKMSAADAAAKAAAEAAAAAMKSTLDLGSPGRKKQGEHKRSTSAGGAMGGGSGGGGGEGEEEVVVETRADLARKAKTGKIMDSLHDSYAFRRQLR